MRRLHLGSSITWICLFLCASVGGSVASAEDAFFRFRLGDAKIVDGKPPVGDPSSAQRNWRLLQAMNPTVDIAGDGEAYLDPVAFAGGSNDQLNWQDLLVTARAAAGKEITLLARLPRADGSRTELVRFSIPATSADAKYATDFHRDKAAHYRRLADRGLPGGAWFKYQARNADTKLPVASRTVADRTQWERDEELIRRFSLFSGGRAISENLQLDRRLNASVPTEANVDIDSLTGITVAEIDWKPLLKDAQPTLDKLASNVPADQHAVFFPSFAAMVQLADEGRSKEMSILRSAQTRAEDANSIDWYERQLGVSTTTLGRMVGPHVIDSVAVTGSDPYFPAGTDVALLFATSQGNVLKNLLLAQMQIAAAKNPDAKIETGEKESVAYRGFGSADRRTSGYTAELPGCIVLTNSLVQLERLVQVSKQKLPTIASLDEFKFFRTRYLLGDKDETAFLFLSDATIRRWCSPRWRIADARRTYTAAVLGELQAENFDALATGKVQPKALQTDLQVVNAGELKLTPRGVVSSLQGTLDWQTPIVELDLKRVTSAEADGYKLWRDRYQSNWRWAFDPIGIRLSIQDGKFAGDMTVMPLIAGTDYRQFIEISRGVSLTENSGDRHNALLHAALAINKDSALFQQGRNMATMLSPDPFGWLGSSVAVYLDDDPLWQELAKLSNEELVNQYQKFAWKLPIGVRAEVANGFKLTAFLATVRAFIEQAAPGMVTWQNLTHRDLPYVKIAPTEQTKGVLGEAADLAIYYAPSAEDLVISLNENVIKRALERRAERKAGNAETAKTDKPAVETELPWLGKNLCLQISRQAIELLAKANAKEYEAAMQTSCWNNLPILNEWKRRYPNQDPVALHERFWHAKLYCPGGGQYVWNDAWQTMESTVYGHPGEPKVGPLLMESLPRLVFANFGLTFEEQGLRARAELIRKK